MTKKVQKLGDFDFGFSLMSEEQIDTVQKAKGLVDENKEKITTLEGTVKKEHERAWKVYNMIIPLLDNLEADPNKEYIYWPTRVEKIEQFKHKLREVLEE